MVPRAMSLAWVCCLLPLALASLPGQPTQGELQFRAPPGRPGHQQKAADPRQQGALLWPAKRMKLIKQVIKEFQGVLEYMNKKHNGTYRRAPGETTHIMVETVHGRMYHMDMVLVNATCPEDQKVGLYAANLTPCEIPPDSPKMRCRMDVLDIYGVEKYYNDEGCHEYLPPPTSEATDNVAFPNGDEVEEGTPYI